MKSTIVYGISMAVLLFLLKWLEVKYLIMDNLFELYAGIIAIVFMVLGAWFMYSLQQKKQEIAEKKQIIQNTEIGLSQRELDVLELMSQGYSNQQIADKLFLSIHTIKTHSSNLFLKLDVKNRTQALLKAKELEIF
ncbi:response regulator transcription factor [Lacihabitans sp. LS3-19]|uniref:response regulator transcription factor n=1 Tax=Lacihabitans sp. LS3-19 TaxID=2487335 RepID=UPI0020CB8740|nr:response regulator transcription factor [Lacihabitans sp. LS3-19]